MENKKQESVPLWFFVVMFISLLMLIVAVADYTRVSINRQTCLFLIPHISGGLSTLWDGGGCFVMKHSDWVTLDDYLKYLQKIYHELYLRDCLNV